MKERIINTSRNLFMTEGIKSVKTDDIAKELGISKKTLYENFESKKEIVDAVVDSFISYMDDKISQIFNNIVQNPDSDFIREIRSMLQLHNKMLANVSKKFAEDLKSSYPENWDKFIEFRTKKFKNYFDEVYEVGVAKGYYKNNLDKTLLFLILSNTANSIITPETMAILPLSLKEAVEEINEVLLFGVMTEKGRKEYDSYQ